MAALVWDATGQRNYEIGVDRGVLYVQKADGTYNTGVVWNGLVGVTESPDGAEPNDLYADNIKYATLLSAETYGATIEAYQYPAEFAECDGSKAVAEGVYIGQQARKPFGFCYRTMVGNDTATDSDDGYKIHIIYNATASPTDRDYETVNDSPDAIKMSWDISTTPVPVTGYKPTATITIDSTKCDATKLKALEDKLYGTASQEPELPTPDYIISTIFGVNPKPNT